MKRYLTPFIISALVISFFSLGIHYRHQHRFQSPEYTAANGGIPEVFNFIDRLEWTLYDKRISEMTPVKAKGVMVATIDEASLNKFGRWPWNRTVYKQILDELYSMGAEAVGFDAVFSEPEWRPEAVEETLSTHPKTLPASIREIAKLDDTQVGVLREMLPQVGEAAFADGLRDRSTVLGYIWSNPVDCEVIDPESANEHSTRSGITAQSLVDSFSSLPRQSIPVPDFAPFTDSDAVIFNISPCIIANRSVLGATAGYQGFFNSTPDSDGIYRRLSPVFGLNATALLAHVPEDEREFLNLEWFEKGAFFAGLSLKSVMAFLDRTDEGTERRHTGIEIKIRRRDSGKLELSGFDILRKSGEKLFVPTNPDGSVPLKFYGSQKIPEDEKKAGRGFYPIGEFSLAGGAGLFDPNFQKTYNLDPELPLKGQIVLIGPTAIGVYDLRPNPTDGTAAGVFLHATFVARLLEYLKSKDPRDLAVQFASSKILMAVLVMLGLLLFFLSMRFKGVAGIWVYLVLLLLLVGADIYLFTQHSISLDSVTLALAFTAIFINVAVYKYLTEERERALVKGAFQRMVSPDVVDTMLQDPKRLNLGGEKKILSVFFSDVRGFTTISESLGAAELAKFMNSYLSPMTDIIFQHRGTLDKYMGDAIMAIFGAPLSYEGHAEEAVDAALDQMKRLGELKEEWKKAGMPPPILGVDIGIGINTGEMSVGNMGSQNLFSYTVLGDSVNLASRLEGLNKEYGSHIIVSEFTFAVLPKEKFICRRLDRVKVKGKTLPVEIYEVVGRHGEIKVSLEKLQAFDQALGLYFDGKFPDAQPIFDKLRSEDPAAELFYERCQIFVQDGAPTDWDGAWTMKTK